MYSTHNIHIERSVSDFTPDDVSFGDEHRAPCFSAIYGLDSPLIVPVFGGTSPRRLQSPRLFLLGPVPLHGLCPIDVSREPSRHRTLPSSTTVSSVPHGHPQPSCAQYACGGEQSQAVADVRGFGAQLDPAGPPALQGRRDQGRTWQHGVRAGQHNGGSQPGLASMGQTQVALCRSEDAHTAGSARSHPRIHCHPPPSRVHNVTLLDTFTHEQGSFYVMDRDT